MTTTPVCENCVMIVDDDPDVRESIAEVLEDSGYRPISAGNGREAMELLRAAVAKPCAILLDMMMPVMDGWQFRAQQQEDPELSSIPVVVVTAHADISEVVAQLDVAAALKKPLQLDALLQTVSRFCQAAPTAE
jgi:CheY-like chemotaxis protein